MQNAGLDIKPWDCFNDICLYRKNWLLLLKLSITTGFYRNTKAFLNVFTIYLFETIEQ